jgi:histone H3/H4
MVKKKMKEKKKEAIQPLIPKFTLKRIANKHKMREDTQISAEAFEQLSKTIDELTGWVIREAERYARDGGGVRIEPEHISNAVKLYFGR